MTPYMTFMIGHIKHKGTLKCCISLNKRCIGKVIKLNIYTSASFTMYFISHMKTFPNLKYFWPQEFYIYLYSVLENDIWVFKNSLWLSVFSIHISDFEIDKIQYWYIEKTWGRRQFCIVLSLSLSQGCHFQVFHWYSIIFRFVPLVLFKLSKIFD